MITCSKYYIFQNIGNKLWSSIHLYSVIISSLLSRLILFSGACSSPLQPLAREGGLMRVITPCPPRIHNWSCGYSTEIGDIYHSEIMCGPSRAVQTRSISDAPSSQGLLVLNMREGAVHACIGTQTIPSAVLQMQILGWSIWPHSPAHATTPSWIWNGDFWPPLVVVTLTKSIE